MNNVMEEKQPNIELRSEEVQELMGGIPPLILRIGIFMWGIFIALILVLAAFVHFPETITLNGLANNTCNAQEFFVPESGRIVTITSKERINVGDTIIGIVPAGIWMDTIYMRSPLSGTLYNFRVLRKGDCVEKNTPISLIVDAIDHTVRVYATISSGKGNEIVECHSQLKMQIDGVELLGNIKEIASLPNSEDGSYSLLAEFALPHTMNNAIIWNVPVSMKIMIKEETILQKVFGWK